MLTDLQASSTPAVVEGDLLEVVAGGTFAARLNRVETLGVI
jgi:hypothetical protein